MLLAIASLSLLAIVTADYSQLDCQLNEVFLQCGQCEGSCSNPRPKCDPTCRGRRCECIAAKGFVRTKHGHCIRATECPGPNIYSEDPYKFMRPLARVSGIFENLARYSDTARDLGKPQEMGAVRGKKFYPANSVRGKDISDLSGLRHRRV
ncbi:hypothetical protein PFISCL1PPCAC_3762 [Pristionchus fissidentatus]|uniref:TIL domain-containing protein n=1 Tax=Pristionchus fissidentatus TaxID=1538716 RepID=A0AAV5V3S7_9BILA|nr:hypothetical protein PFISCL1PPCAC_3762 [Pristionchus fissidentatus]